MPVDYELGNDDKANAQTFNILFGDINARLKTLEKSSSAINQASDELVEVGLAKINPAVDAALAALDNVSELSNLFEAHSKSEVEIVTGLTEFIIEPDDRPHFVAPKFLVLYVPGQLDNWVAGQTQSLNKETGQLLIDITNVSGTGVHSDWTVAPVAMMPDAGPTIDAYTKTEVDSAIAQAKADGKTETKNELLGGAGPAHDTLQELVDLLDDSDDALVALTTAVGQKADLAALEGKADLVTVEQALENTVRASGDQVFDDGGAQVRENIGAEVNLGELHLQDQKPQGVGSGSSVGGTWNPRELNVELNNTIAGASLTNNRFTLPVGSFKLKAKSSSYVTSRVKLQIYNITDDVYENINDPNDYSNSSYGGYSVTQCEGTLTVTGSPKEYELRMYVQSSKSINGLGVENNIVGFVEVYSDVFIRKVA